MKKVIFPDFLRPKSSVDNIARIKALFNDQLLHVENNLKLNQSYKVWLDNFEYLSPYYIDEIQRHISGNIMYVGWELPPSICRFFRDRSIKFMSIGVSPIRLLDDYDIYLVTNIEKIYGLQWDAYIKFKRKIFLKSSAYDCIELSDHPYSENYILGQLPLDSASIKEGRFCGVSDVVSAFKIKDYILVSHPHSKVFGKHIIKADRLSYRILKFNQNSKIYTFSSSLQYESLMFDNKNEVEAVHDYYKVYREIDDFQLIDFHDLGEFVGSNHQVGSIKNILNVRW